jgi:hypothetical protein
LAPVHVLDARRLDILESSLAQAIYVGRAKTTRLALGMKSPTAKKKKKAEWRDGWCYDTEGRVIRGVGLGSIAERKKDDLAQGH